MKKEASLEPVKQNIGVGIEKDFNPKEYFKTRKGLWVSGYFAENILSKTETVTEDKELKISSFKLLKYSTDKEIETELPKEHIFTETEACAIIASLIEKQPKGKEGELLADGNWNLFYTPAFVVLVRWYAGGGGWGVCVWGRDGLVWGDDCRVFSPAN